MMNSSKIAALFVSRDIGERDDSVDAFRGLAIIGMILVNHAPPTPDIFSSLTHAEWLGWTLADTIFPAFLFLVGISISLSVGASGRVGGSFPWVKVIRRTGILILLSILLINFPYYELSTFKVHGTLSRIAVCYFFAVLFAWHIGWKSQLVTVIGILCVQWWLLTQFEVPGVGAGVLTITGNGFAYVDRLLLGDFAGRFVVEGPSIQGLFPIAGSVASTLIGVVTGHWLQTNIEIKIRVNGLFAIGFILFIAGLMVDDLVPISKRLYTPSYVVLMTGISLQTLAFFYWLGKYRLGKITSKPLQIAGLNALFFYVFAQSFQRILVYGRLSTDDGDTTRLRYLVYDNVFAPWLPGKSGALLYAVLFLSICYVVVYFLYRQKIFVKL